MTDRRDELIDVYAGDFARRDLSYTLMGMMLDRNLVQKRVKDFDLRAIYIYGGNPLGVQLYRCVKEYCTVKAIIETDGYLYQNRDYEWGLDEPDIPVIADIKDISFDKSQDKVIICELNSLETIKAALSDTVDDEAILFINELLYGGVRNAVYD